MSPKKSKAADVVAEAPAQSAEVDLREATSAAVESKPVEPGELVCGPLRLKRDGKGYGYQPLGIGFAPPQPSVRVMPQAHGWGASAALGQAGLVSTKATHPKPEQAAAELAALITTALERAQAHQRSRAPRRRANALDRVPQPQAEVDLQDFCRRVGWVGA